MNEPIDSVASGARSAETAKLSAKEKSQRLHSALARVLGAFFVVVIVTVVVFGRSKNGISLPTCG